MSSLSDRLAASRQARQASQQPPLELATVGPTSETAVFLAEDAALHQDILQFKQNVSQIATLRLQSLSAISDAPTIMEQIDSLTTDTRALMQQVKDRIQRLEAAPANQDTQLRKNRLKLLHSKFIEALQDYQREEHESRQKSRDRVARQLKIVKADATQEEIDLAVQGGAQQVFADALTSSTQYGQSRAAYLEVQNRQKDIQRVEQTLAELAVLFSDMALLVQQQDEVIDNVHTTVANVSQDVEQAHEHTKVAVIHARNYRKYRWYCFFLTLLVLAILAVVLGIVFGRR